MTPAQLQAFKTDIAGSEFAGLPNNSDTAITIASAYNAAATPDYFVYRTSVPIIEIMQNGFDWTRVDNLTVGKARVWEFMTSAELVNAAQPNVRAGIIATFATAGDQAMRLAIFTHCQRLATRVEKLFAVGAGTTTTDQGVGPATMAFESPVSPQEVETARNLP